MSDLDRLLDLQANDTTADQLRHRRATLPERTELAEVQQRRAAREAGAVEPRALRDELARDQKRLEDEVAIVEDKAGSVDRQLYGGGVTAPKEAQALQADLESIKRRQATLEDQIIELMEQLEPMEASLAEADADVAALTVREGEVRAAMEAAESAVDAELAHVVTARAELAAQVGRELLDEYDRLRPPMDGVAVARLAGATCQGCHLTLAAAEVDQIRHLPADAVAHCPDCGRLLVR